jgi:hypothetical protein
MRYLKLNRKYGHTYVDGRYEEFTVRWYDPVCREFHVEGETGKRYTIAATSRVHKECVLIS